MRVLVTGITGMLGSDCARHFGKHHEVWGIARGEKKALPTDERYSKADICDQKEIAAVFARVRPEVVIHTAAFIEVDGCEKDQGYAKRVNYLGAGCIAEACKKYNSLMVHISTDYVFDGKANTPYKEIDPVEPVNFYGLTKCEAEVIVAKIVEKHFIIRASWLFGKGGNNFIEWVLRQAEEKKPIYAIDDQVSAPTSTDDLAATLLCMVEATKGPVKGKDVYGIYHVTNQGQCSRYEEARAILDYAGIHKGALIPVKKEILALPAVRPSYTVLSTQKLKDTFGISLRPWQEAIKEYIKH